MYPNIVAGVVDRYPNCLTVARNGQKTTMIKFAVVRVLWADACTSDPGWQDFEDLVDEPETLVDTVGFLIPEGEHGSRSGYVSVWQTLSGLPSAIEAKERDALDGLHGFYIPLAMVRTLTVLQPALP